MPVVLMEDVELLHRRRIAMGGAVCDVRCNSAALVRMLLRSTNAATESERTSFTLDVHVNDVGEAPLGKPHFRGMHHVVVASFGSENIFLFDLLRQQVSATVSATAARNTEFWSRQILPITLGIMGAAIGIVPMHCACLALNGEGLLLAGASGAGKSTLAAALSQSGFDYLSDDWTYINAPQGMLLAHGMRAPVKLLPDAVRHFARLDAYPIQNSMNGELAYEVDAEDAFGASIAMECAPRWLVFVERGETQESESLPMASAQVRHYLESSVERLPEELPEAAQQRAAIMERVAQLPCWRFRYGGTPQFAAQALREFVAHRRQAVCV